MEIPPNRHIARWPSMSPMTTQDSVATLQAENTRLIALLEAHGIDWRLPVVPATPPLSPVAEAAMLQQAKRID